MDHVVGAELAFAISRAGFPTLRFNYRGVGASQGKQVASPSRLEELLEDARAALELTADNTPGKPVLVAVGASDAVALELSGQVSRIVLVSPSLVTADEVAGRAQVVVPEHGYVLAEWSAKLVEDFVVIAGMDKTYTRNLPQLGKAVVGFVAK